MNENNLVRRFGKEINKLLDEDNIITIKRHDNNTIIKKKYTENLELSFILSNDHPFKTPQVYINKIIYCDYLLNQKNYIKKLILELNLSCPCCYNIVNEWSPGYYLLDISHEYEKNMRLFNYLLKLSYVKRYFNDKFINKEYIFMIKQIYNYL